jgi:hypothetical protein
MATLNSKFMREEKHQALPGRELPFYDIRNVRSSDLLGIVEWYGPWRQYCFSAEEGCVFSAGCLKDIEAFLLALMAERAK